MTENRTPHGDPLLEVGATYVSDQETPVLCGYGPRLPNQDPAYLPRLHPFTVIDPMERMPDDWYAVRATVEGYKGEYLLSFALNSQAAKPRVGGTLPWVTRVHKGLRPDEDRGTLDHMDSTIEVSDQSERAVVEAALRQYREDKAANEAAEAKREEQCNALVRLGASLGLDGEPCLDVYPVYENTDLTEGKGGSRPVGYFFTEAEALDAYSDGVQGVYGGRASWTEPLRPIQIYLTADDWRAATGRKGH